MAGGLTSNINKCKGAKQLDKNLAKKIGRLDLSPNNMLKNLFLAFLIHKEIYNYDLQKAKKKLDYYWKKILRK